MSDVVINVSYCAAHKKSTGPDIPGHLHAQWLLDCVLYLKKLTGWPVIVSMTGWAGMLNCPTAQGHPEREIMWKVWQEARLLGIPENPGHQVGAGMCLRMGLEAAAYTGVPYLLHTAEDVLPKKEACQFMVDKLREGYDYVGHRCDASDELNSRFFACRVNAIAGVFNPSILGLDVWFERCLSNLFRGMKICDERCQYGVTYYDGQLEQWYTLLQEAST